MLYTIVNYTLKEPLAGLMKKNGLVDQLNALSRKEFEAEKYDVLVITIDKLFSAFADLKEPLESASDCMVGYMDKRRRIIAR